MELLFQYFMSFQAHLFSVLGKYNNHAFNTVCNTDIYNTDNKCGYSKLFVSGMSLNYSSI